MNITERQFGKLEAAQRGLRKLTERNKVGTELCSIIMDVLTEITAQDWPAQRLPEPPIADRRDMEMIRDYGREILASESGTIPAIRMICEHFGLRDYEFARLIGSSRASLSRYLNGDYKERSSVLPLMTEFFGYDGGASRTSRTGRTEEEA